MNKEELERASASILRRAKEKAFFKGRPIIFSENDKVYEEWADGIIVERTKIAQLDGNELTESKAMI